MEKKQYIMPQEIADRYGKLLMDINRDALEQIGFMSYGMLGSIIATATFSFIMQAFNKAGSFGDEKMELIEKAFKDGVLYVRYKDIEME